MNIVKGVAGLLRKTSSLPLGNSPVESQDEGLSPQLWPDIQFSDAGNEAVLESQWEKYEMTTVKEEKERSLEEFLSHFLQVFQDWRPPDLQHELSDSYDTNGVKSRVPSESIYGAPESVKGCTFGHPTRIVLVLTQEIKAISEYLIEWQSFPQLTDVSPNPYRIERGLKLLDALCVLTRSAHNQNIFSYYGGFQMLVLLMKVSVLLLKELANEATVEQSLPYSLSVQFSFLKCLLAQVVSIILNFVDMPFKDGKKFSNSDYSLGYRSPRNVEHTSHSLQCQSARSRMPSGMEKLTLPLLETGGLNWFVELLRVLRGLRHNNHIIEKSLESLTLRTLKAVLIGNPRAQNLFKTVGGLTVVLDGIEFHDLKIMQKSTLLSDISDDQETSLIKRSFEEFELQIQYLEILREAIYGNTNCLLSVFDNGAVEKFSLVIRWAAFILPNFNSSDYQSDGDIQHGKQTYDFGTETDYQLQDYFHCSSAVESEKKNTSASSQNSLGWNFHVAQVCRILWSFLIPAGDVHLLPVHLSCGDSRGLSNSYLEHAMRWIIKVLALVFSESKYLCKLEDMIPESRLQSGSLQQYILYVFRKIITASPPSLKIMRDENVWNLLFSKYFFYFKVTSSKLTKNVPNPGQADKELSYDGAKIDQCKDVTTLACLDVPVMQTEAIQMDVIALIELAATSNGCKDNMVECSVLISALNECAYHPQIVTMLAKCLHRILQLAPEPTVLSFRQLDAMTQISTVMNSLIYTLSGVINIDESSSRNMIESIQEANCFDSICYDRQWDQCTESLFSLLAEYFGASEDAKVSALYNVKFIENLFNMLCTGYLRKFALKHILDLLKLSPSSEKEQEAKLGLCLKYFETFPNTKDSTSADKKQLSADLLAGVRDVVRTDMRYYQALFCDGECFLHIVTLLNGNFDDELGEKLCIDVIKTLTDLLSGNEASKVTFRSLVGTGYKTLEKLLLNCCKGKVTLDMLNALLDMLVDGSFSSKPNKIIENEDVILMFFDMLRQGTENLKCIGLDNFGHLLEESTANGAYCVRAGLLSFLLDWYGMEESEILVSSIGRLIKLLGGHSITGKDMRKIFSLLRSTQDGVRPRYGTGLLSILLDIFKGGGPSVFFDFNGRDSGIVLTSSVRWPSNRGYTFSCWLRIERFPQNNELMGLFSFLTVTGKGCTALFDEERIIIETISSKTQTISLGSHMPSKRWFFFCITHSAGRAFSGGNTLKCYVDASLVGVEKLRYPKVTEPLTECTIGTRIPFTAFADPKSKDFASKLSLPFCGQLGPIYLFDGALSSDQILGMFSLGPMYMYTFQDTEVGFSEANSSTYGVLDPKEGLASKIIFGFNAQASASGNLFDISPMSDNAKDQKPHEATLMPGTQLCCRSVVRDILDCVGGVSVFFPLLTQLDQPVFFVLNCDNEELPSSIVKSVDDVAAQVIELIASALDGNSTNQEFMYKMSGFSILGFLLQSVSPRHLTQKVVSALGQLLAVIGKSDSKVTEMLVENILRSIYLNPHIWIYTHFSVQRELYMFLLNCFDSHSGILCQLCRLPSILDIICQFYWDRPKNRQAFGYKPLFHPLTKETIGERPTSEEIGKIRLLLLSLAEVVLRQNVLRSDVNSLVAFLEKSDDPMCVEDVLHMVLRLTDHKPFLLGFLDHVLALGGCRIFLNLLRRKSEITRLQGLQVLGKLLMSMLNEKKGNRLFPLGVGITKSSLENQYRDKFRSDIIVSAMADRLLAFPFTDAMHATLFDILLGGASPKQVLQRLQSIDRQLAKRSTPTLSSTQFALPQILSVLFRFMKTCEELSTRENILRDLHKLLEASNSNIDCLILESGWQSWFLSILYDTELRKHVSDSRESDSVEGNEEILIRSIFCIIHFHCICDIKGGWHQIDQTISFVILHFQQRQLPRGFFMHNLVKDLIQGLLNIASEQELLSAQPCRDNALYLLTVIDEILIDDTCHFLKFPQQELLDALKEDKPSGEADIRNLYMDPDVRVSSSNQSRGWQQCSSKAEDPLDDRFWQFYDQVWMFACEMYGKSTWKKTSGPTNAGPSLGQRARGLVESLNVPAVEMAAAVVTGGLGAVVNISTSKLADKAIRLRGEKFPRIFTRLLLLYLYKAELEKASHCVQQFIALLPCLLSTDNEQLKNRLQLFIWTLLDARAHVGSYDNARFHVISQLIRETVKNAKSLLAMSIAGKDNLDDTNISSNEVGSVISLLHKDRVLAAVREEMNYLKSMKAERQKQISDICSALDEASSQECEQKKILEDEIQSNLSVICSNDGNRRVASRLAYDEEQQLVTDKWCHIFRDLTDERGAWSPVYFPNENATHWKLDRTEDSWRRRLKLKRNYFFDEQLCHPPVTTVGECEARPNVDGTHTNLKNFGLGEAKSFLLKGLRRISEEEISDAFANKEDDNSSLNFPSSVSEPVVHETSEPVELMADADDRDNVDQQQEQTSRLIETGQDEVVVSVSCVLVTPKWKMAGHLDVMKSFLHFYGEFLVEGTGGSRVFNGSAGLNYPDSLASHVEILSTSNHSKSVLRSEGDGDKGNAMERFDPVQQRQLANKKIKDVKRHRRWEISKVKAVHLTRYLLRYTSIEVFFNNSAPPVFLNFSSERHAKEVGKQIVSLRNELLLYKSSSKFREEVIYLVDRRFAIELAERAKDGWRRREISNFEYLMILNTLSGRSYNDLTQYPVFPWILADYTSPILDLNKSSTFRDLSEPVGALDTKRLEIFEERYQNFCDPDIPSFYYGSHYSSMGSVLFYLLRLEPFTTLHRSLQGGRFDHADRLFHSIEASYANCLSNTSDVKELIPEFFYMPEFLINSNKYHFGIKQDGEPLGDAVLPPWAKNSPEEFILKNREALESEHVSSNLHHWIDLIFGYKQRGKPAIEAANVFYHLTYEGAVDLEAIDDPLQRAAIEDQIANFGQTPIQLFRKKHPKRGPPTPINHPIYYAPSSITLTSVVPTGFGDSSAIIFVALMDSTIVLVSRGLVTSAKMWLTSQIQSGGNLTFSSSQEPSFAVGPDIFPYRKIASPMANNIELSSQCFATLQVQSSIFLLYCGNWDYSLRVLCLNDGRMVQSIRQHKDLVSCVSVPKDGSVVVTGSHDTTVMVWEVAGFNRLKSNNPPSFQDRIQKDHIFSDKPLHILYGHDDIITSVAVSVELDLVVSASTDSSCILYSLRQGRYVRSIQHPSHSPLSKIVLSQHGQLVLYSNEDLNLFLYSINGKHLASSESNGRVSSMALSRCGEFLVCSGDKGQIVLRSMHSLEILSRYDALGKGILSISVTPEDCFLAGTQDGNLLLYSIETAHQRKVNPQNTKSRTSSVI